MAEDTHMSLWGSVCETDPSKTRQISLGSRRFTAIDAHYLVKRATETFGPVGQGWSWSAEYDQIHVGSQVIAVCDLTIHWGPKQEQLFAYRYGPVRTTNALVDAKGRYDEDAFKKAMTDALTKALSHLGFGADVHMGQFDDVRYVQEVKAKFSGEPPAQPATRVNGTISAEQYQALVDLVQKTGTEEAKVCAAYKCASLELLPANAFNQVSSILKKRLNHGATA